jgi:AraC-like DNA-binding protein
MLNERQMRFVSQGQWRICSPLGKAGTFFDFVWTHEAKQARTTPMPLFPHWKTSIIVRRQWSAPGVLSSVEIGALGPLTTSSVMHLPPLTELVGINLHPEFLPQILDIMPHEIKDTLIDLSHDTQFQKTMAYAEMRLDLTVIAERLFYDVLRIWEHSKRKVSNNILHAVSEIRLSRGTLKIDEITHKSGISARSLHRHFINTIGVSPKYYSRSERLKNLVLETDKYINPDWSSIAQDFGFSDQAHMTREVSSLVGLSPKKFHHLRKADISNS